MTTSTVEQAAPEPRVAPREQGELDGSALAELVERVSEDRDRRAFALLFEHFAPRLKSYFVRLGVDDATAEDLVQDAMLQLWNRAGDYNPSRAAVSTWLFTIARNLGIDRIRRERRYDPEVPPEDAVERTAHAPHAVAGPTPEAALQTERRSSAVRVAVESLPDAQRRVVELHYGAWLTTAEIARRERISQGTVKSRLRLAISRLRAVLEER